MVGIGTSEVNLEMFKYSFGSLLGYDEDSWGLSYTGKKCCVELTDTLSLFKYFFLPFYSNQVEQVICFCVF